VDFEDEG
jgi:hypothetical protein